jgi:drug/metabolite transporter (DMT)-like permease
MAEHATMPSAVLTIFASLFYVVLMTSYDLLISASSHHQKGFKYHSASVITLAEAGKFTVNFIANIVDRFMAKKPTVISESPDPTGIYMSTMKGSDGMCVTKICQIVNGATWSNMQAPPVEGWLDGFMFDDWRGDGKPQVGDILESVNDQPVGTTADLHDHHRLVTTSRQGRSALKMQFRKPVTRINLVALKWLGLPAVLYACLNLLSFQSLLHVDLSNYGIFYNINMLFVAILWTVFFNKKFSQKQWATVCMLPICCAIVRIRPDHPGKLFSWDWGLLFVIGQALVSSLASVGNEYAYKRHELKSMSLPEQNMVLYCYGVLSLTVFQLSAFAITEKDEYNPRLFFIGFNWETILILCLMISIGVTMSVILKKLSNIVKIFAIAFQTPSEVILSHFILNTPLTFLVGIAVASWLWR